MAWLTFAATVAQFGDARRRGERLEDARFRFRLFKAAFSRRDNLPAGFVLAAGLLDHEVDWLQEPAPGEAWF